MTKSHDLPPVISEAEQQEVVSLTAFLRHDATGQTEDGTDDDEGMLRLAELIDLLLADATEWRAYIAEQEQP